MRMEKKIVLGKAVPKSWFRSDEAKELKEKMEKSTKALSDSMRASLIVDSSLLKSKISV